MSAFQSALATALSAAPISPEQSQLLEEHWRLVLAWNRRVNLTAIEDDTEAAWLHYADSLAGRSHLIPGPIVDLGSGAGYPGLPLAICHPDRPVTLVEPRQKRASFLDVCCTRLGLTNVRVLVARSTDEPPANFPNVVTRATFSDNTDLTACLNWTTPTGRLIAYRANAIESQADQIVPYHLRADTHALHIWNQRP
jgi:16S rRNA (guanine527-N7)-methyltransferase